MQTLTTYYRPVKMLLAWAFIATLVFNVIALLVLTLSFNNEPEPILFTYSCVSMVIICLTLWITFKQERSLFWPYWAVMLSASVVVVSFVVITSSLLNWFIDLCLALAVVIWLALNAANLSDKTDPPSKVIYVTYQLLSAASLLVYYFYLLPK